MLPAVLGPALTLLAYLLGSIGTGLLLARRRGVDLRSIGSGNIGATNVGRALGKGTGRLVLVLDALKGFVPALLARLMLGPADPWTAATGFAAAFGHCFPVWHGFRGGKGAATAAGVLLAVVPPAGVLAGLTFFGLRKASRRASVGSLGGAAVGATATLALGAGRWPSLMALGLLLLVVLRHRDNLGRLLTGREPES
jgi:acyl phosphate:glycerol-3-phosphate acyltransferase